MLVFPPPFQFVTVAFPKRAFISSCFSVLLSRALCFLREHTEGLAGQGKETNECHRPLRGGHVWLHGQKGLASVSTYKTLRCPALELSHATPHPPPHLKIISSAVPLLRTALRKSLEVSDIYQDQKGRFGKCSVLLTPLQSSWFTPRGPDCFFIFFYSENASINGSILHQLMLLCQPVRKLWWRGIRNLE